MEEWDPEKGGSFHAYVAQAYLDPGCKAIEDAYDAARENAPKDSHGHPITNGIRVRLRSWDEVQSEKVQARAEETRKQKQERKEPSFRSPFYPFPS